MSTSAQKLDASATELDEALGGASRARTVTARGEKIVVKPMTVRQLRAFMPHARPLVSSLNALLKQAAKLDKVEGLGDLLGSVDFVDVIDRHGEQCVAAVAAAVDRDPTWIDDALPDELLELVTAVVAVNLDFFVRRLIPAAGRGASALAGELLQLRGLGRTASRRLSGTDTD